jgi:hypothetical protein
MPVFPDVTVAVRVLALCRQCTMIECAQQKPLACPEATPTACGTACVSDLSLNLLQPCRIILPLGI